MINIFTAVRHLTFVTKLFAAAKLNLDDVIAAGDETALQAHIAAQVAAAAPADTSAHAAAITAKDNELTQLRDRATKAEARTAEILGALATAKITVAADAKPDAIGAAIDSRITIAGGEDLAKRGLRDFPEQKIEDDPAKAAVAKIDAKQPPLVRLTARLKAAAKK